MSSEKNTMQKALFFILILVVSFMSCKKDNDNSITGTVQVKGGCFLDSWLVAIDNPDPAKHSFLRATSFATATLYNCSNAVFITLMPELAKAGTKIRFSGITNYGVSCLSSSEAPNHITAEKMSGF